MAETTTTTTAAPAPESAPTPTPAPAPATAPAPAPPPARGPPAPGVQFVAAPANLPPKYVSPRSYWVTKLVGRTFSIICSIVAIGLGAGLMADSRIDGIYALFIVPSRGIHPGAIVGVDLILWLGLVFLTLLCVAFSTRSARYHINGYSNYYDSWSGTRSPSIDLDTPEYQALLKKIKGLSEALSAFFCFLTLTHFGLFVIGCVETNIRNRQPRMVYVMAPTYGYPTAPPPGVLPAPYGAPMMAVHPQPVPMMPMQPGPVHTGEPKPPVVQGSERYA
ncbi:hypothetical protein B0T21DRAFT_432311 [Apiosordaria backusii]|uniref:Uncharacterized protein n=1 Tax=Apiosordaria backusii TaxID=314023 RepID=A0AA39ZPP9_9PEZI|nr:hypothetical protein B0T21DRAFT_432311 [Apiosordaria backusii]